LTHRGPLAGPGVQEWHAKELKELEEERAAAQRLAGAHALVEEERAAREQLELKLERQELERQRLREELDRVQREADELRARAAAVAATGCGEQARVAVEREAASLVPKLVEEYLRQQLAASLALATQPSRAAHALVPCQAQPPQAAQGWSEQSEAATCGGGVPSSCAAVGEDSAAWVNATAGVSAAAVGAKDGEPHGSPQCMVCGEARRH
jgi:hypothetical protein